jgi:hypothetical protein
MSAADTPLPRSPRLTRNAPLARYLNVSAMTVHRWKRDPELNFPPPSVVNKIEYTDLNLVDEWLITRRVDRTKQCDEQTDEQGHRGRALAAARTKRKHEREHEVA